MAMGLNKVFLIGHLGDEPNITKKNDFMCARVSLATGKSWKDKNGNKVEHTEWHRVVFFNKLADIVEKFLHKGALIHVEGYIKASKYTDKDGIERYSTEIIAEEMKMLGGKKEGYKEQRANPYGQEDGHARAEHQHEAHSQEFYDDIPF